MKKKKENQEGISEMQENRTETLFDFGKVNLINRAFIE